MEVKETIGRGTYLYTGTIDCEKAGEYGLTSRVLPKGDDWIRNTPELITWAK